MEITLTKEEIIKAVSEEMSNDATSLFELLDECTSTYEPLIDVFVMLAKQLKDADRISDEVLKTVTDYVA